MSGSDDRLKLQLRPFVGYVRTLVSDARGVGNRAAITVVVPLLTVWAVGHLEWAGYAAFVAMTSLYGRARFHINRFDMQLSAGLCLLAAVLSGVLVSLSPIGYTLSIPVAMVIAALGAVISDAQDWHPRGPLFLIFAFGTMATAPHQVRDLLIALIVGGLTLVWALFIGAVWVLREEQPVPHLWRQRMRVGFDLHRSWQPVEFALAVGLSGVISVASGVGHPFWAMVAAVVPLAAQDLQTKVKRAFHRIIGTLGGLVLAYAILLVPLPVPAQILMVGVLQLVAELFVARNYAVALLFITPLALLMGQLAHPSPIPPVVYQRGAETIIGSVVGLALVYASHALAARASTPPESF